MKVIIDLIEDIGAAINNDKEFSLAVMGLKEDENNEFIPSWQSGLCSFRLEPAQKKVFLFLGKEEGLNIGEFLTTLNTLKNEELMYELCVSYSKEDKRIDSSLIGFGESFKDKKYLVFIPE